VIAQMVMFCPSRFTSNRVSTSSRRSYRRRAVTVAVDPEVSVTLMSPL
jgi:hypothetical protein